MTASVTPQSRLDLDALRRTIQRPRPSTDPAEHCQLCDADIPGTHRHMLEEQSGEVLCVCHACRLLFEREAAGRGHYRLIPDRRIRLPAFDTGGLGVPVGLAFFIAQSDGRVIAHYPSPMGVTQWELDHPAWQEVIRERPEIAELVPAVEAILVNTTRGATEHWLVPIDDCYRLVAVIRRHWRGLSGGDQVWPAIDRFFAGLTEGPHRHTGREKERKPYG